MMKKTYISPAVKAVCIAADSILTGSIHSSDANTGIDELCFDTEGNKKVSTSAEVW